MRSDEDFEIRLTFLEDQLNRMNVVLAAQGRRIDELSSGLSELAARIRGVEEQSPQDSSAASLGSPGAGGPSERPPDGRNR